MSSIPPCANSDLIKNIKEEINTFLCKPSQYLHSQIISISNIKFKTKMLNINIPENIFFKSFVNFEHNIFAQRTNLDLQKY